MTSMPGRTDAGQHQAGKLTARERLELLLDEGSFGELGAALEHPGDDRGGPADQSSSDGVVTGFGTISGRTIFVFAEDATGSDDRPFEAHARKIVKVQDAALRAGAPIVGLYDAPRVGARHGTVQGALAEMLERSVTASGIIPQIALIMGPCTGAGAFAPPLGDFTFMVRDAGHMFVAGPPVVKAVFNETVTEEALGGAEVHATRSALAHDVFANDVEALLQVRRLIDFLPSSNAAPPPRWPSPRAEADDAALDTLLPEDAAAPYDIKDLIARVADDGDVFAIQEAHAKNIVIAFGRVEGRTVGFVANQPAVLAGALDANAARKAARFVRFCDCFDIPLVTIVDVPGVLPGIDAEQGGLAGHVAKLIYAYAEASVPKVTVTTRKAFGAAYAVMAPKQLRGDLNLAWPSAQLAPLAAAGGDVILSPFASTQQGVVDEIIFPRESRRKVARALDMLRGKRSQVAWKKHGNIPL